MKYSVAILASLLVTASLVFAQQYKNALQIPHLVKNGYTGKIKRIITTSYDARIVSGRPVKTKLTSIGIDSFNKEGYILLHRDSLSSRRTVYRYNEHNEYISSESFTEGTVASRQKTRLLSSSKYVIETYFDIDSKYRTSPTPDVLDTLVFTGNLQTSESSHLGTSLIDYVSRDTTIMSIFDGLVVVTNVILERDIQGNKTKESSIPEVETDNIPPTITLYVYEYY